MAFVPRIREYTKMVIDKETIVSYIVFIKQRMLEKINEQVSVITIYNRDKGVVLPYKVRWNGRDYIINKLGYHYRVKRGRFTHHIFTVSNSSIAFKLFFDTETLFWWVKEVSDGLTGE